MAVALAKHGKDVTYADCDVEEPNGHIFLKPLISAAELVSLPVPQINEDLCTYCGECARICEYNAIAVFANKILFFPSLCHSCGGCYHICPEKAIIEIPRPIGELRFGEGQGVKFIEGSLNIGESISPPVTHRLKNRIGECEVVLIDAPPGTSCPVIEAIEDSDYVILVTEPTPFGLNDLKLAVAMVRQLELPMGVIINRAGLGNNQTESYCKNEGIDILLKVPFDRKLAESYSRGNLHNGDDGNLSEQLYGLYHQIRERSKVV